MVLPTDNPDLTRPAPGEDTYPIWILQAQQQCQRDNQNLAVQLLDVVPDDKADGGQRVTRWRWAFLRPGKLPEWDGEFMLFSCSQWGTA